jgi:hypothetical protein
MAEPGGGRKGGREGGKMSGVIKVSKEEGGREGDVPMTSAKSQAAMAISAVTHRNMEKRVE